MNLEILQEKPLLDNAVVTFPKSGTQYLHLLMQMLNMEVAIDHFTLDTELTRSYWIQLYPWRLRKPEQFVGKTIIVRRDLKDCISSAAFWIKKNAQSIVESPHGHHNIALINSMEFLCDSYDEQLLKVIKSERMASGLMTNTRYSLDLMDLLLKEKPHSTRILKFEDFIGQEAGGNLCDNDRFELFSDICSFFGYQRSVDEIKIAVEKTFGKCGSYNPVKKKVGRWKDEFKEMHIAAFKEFWESRNLSLGYPPIQTK